MKLRSFFLSVIFLTVFFFSIQTGHACDCMMFSLEQEIQRAQNIFSGKAQSMSAVYDEELKREVVEVIFLVQHTYKGDASGQFKVRGQGTNCDFPFHLGFSYLVYTQVYPNAPSAVSTSQCSATKPLQDAGKDIKELEDKK